MSYSSYSVFDDIEIESSLLDRLIGLLADGVSMVEISEITGISIEELNVLLSNWVFLTLINHAHPSHEKMVQEYEKFVREEYEKVKKDLSVALDAASRLSRDHRELIIKYLRDYLETESHKLVFDWI